MEDNKTCNGGEQHEHHICALHNKGMFDEVEQLTDRPTVTCAVCLVNANSPENVCSPTTLGGGFSYSHMHHHKQVPRDGDVTEE